MKQKLLFLTILFFLASVAYSQTNMPSGGWEKFGNNPILGRGLGDVYDPCVIKGKNGIWQMYFSWYESDGIALSESADGLKWTDPSVCISVNSYSANRDHVNRPCVIIKDGIYHIWYSHQDATHVWIEYATSADGKSWAKKGSNPVLVAETDWEKAAVQLPCVIWDGQEKLFKMWYSAGDQTEPDAIGYATSKNGISWKKYANNPVFTASKSNSWEQAKVGGCQVIKRTGDYLMFYTGYSDPNHAQIGMARSKNGITNWERFDQNPILSPGASGWDSYSVYKPCAVPDPDNNRWLLWYEGRRGWNNQIGLAIHKGMDLKF